MTTNPFAGELSADRFTVKKILDLARSGRLRIPPFQRPLRWRRPDHLLLLDSLYRRYPVGTLLLWQRSAPAAAVVFGDFSVAAGRMDDALWIVDGQQRITSIIGCLIPSEGPARGRRKSDFAFVFDLNNDRFVEDTGRSDASLVPVNQLFDPVQTSEWARENDVGSELHRKAQEVGSRLLAYEIPTYVTRAESDQTLRTIFARANTAGRRMRSGEVFEALNRGLEPDASPSGLTERLQQVLYALDFGTVDGDDLQRALVCVAGHNPRNRLPDALLDPGAAATWEQKAADGLRRTVDFLREAAAIPHARMLPYSLPLIMLPGFFHRFPQPRERSIELLTRWVWRGIARRQHMATNQNFNPLHNALKRPLEEDVVQGFLQQVGRTAPAEFPESPAYNVRGMSTKLELAILFRRGPRELTTGKPLSPVEIFEEEDEDEDEDESQAELFDPRGGKDAFRIAHDKRHQLPALPVGDKALRLSVAARFLHPRRLGGTDLPNLLAAASAENLASHLIPRAALPSVKSKDWSRVVMARQKALRSDTKIMIDRLARWNEDDDAPSIETIIGEDDQPDATP